MENVFEIKGKIYSFGELKDGFDNGYKKRDIFVEYNAREYDGKNYSDIIKMKTEKQRTDSLSMYSVGDEIKVGFTLTGRMWNPPDDPKKEVNFTDVKVIWMEKLNAVQKTEPQAATDINNESMGGSIDDDDTLPF